MSGPRFEIVQFRIRSYFSSTGEIYDWAEEHEAKQTFECERCGHNIVAGSIYVRRVFRQGKRLRPEREHVCPDCADWSPDCGKPR